MSIIEIAVMLVAATFAILVGFLVPVLIQLRNAVAESDRLFTRMNADLPPLVMELRAMSQNLNELAAQTRGGVQHAAVMLHAIGDIGESMQEVHSMVRGSSGTLLSNMASMVAGFKAVTQVVRDRMKHDGGPYNGG